MQTNDEAIISLKTEVTKLKSENLDLTEKIIELKTINIKLQEENLKLKRRTEPLPPIRAF
jgi:hypothetical protein